MATNSVLLTLFFLFITLTIKLKFSIAAVPLLDTDGDILNATTSYDILPLDWGTKHGGIAIRVVLRDGTFSIILSNYKTDPGMSVCFSNATASSKVIVADDLIMVNFVLIENKLISPWHVIYDEVAKVWFLSAGPTVNYPGHKIKRGKFRISYVNSDYKLVFCSDTNISSCKDIGIYKDSAGNSRLAFDRPALLVKFKKARIY